MSSPIISNLTVDTLELLKEEGTNKKIILQKGIHPSREQETITHLINPSKLIEL